MLISQFKEFPKGAALEDQETMTKIEELVDKLRSGHHAESIITNLGKKGKFKKFSEGTKDTMRKLGNIELYELERFPRLLNAKRA